MQSTEFVFLDDFTGVLRKELVKQLHEILACEQFGELSIRYVITDEIFGK